MKGLETLLSKLQGVKPQSKGRWSALCPAHEDRNPSLSIREEEDRVLIHCFVGCGAQDVLDALEMTFRDLYRDAGRAGYEQATARARAKATPWSQILDIDRWVLRIGVAQIESGKRMSLEDAARMRLAQERLGGAGQSAGGTTL